VDSKKPLGKHIKEQLESANFAPRELSWETINASLKKRRRRRLFWYFLSGTGILALVLALSWPKIEEAPVGPKTIETIPYPISYELDSIRQGSPEQDMGEKNPVTLESGQESKSDFKRKRPTSSIVYGHTFESDSLSDDLKKLGAKQRTKLTVTISQKDTLANDSTIQKEKGTTLKKRKIQDSKKDSLKKNEAKKWTISIHAAPMLNAYLSRSNLLLPETLDRTSTTNLSWSYRFLFNIPITEKTTFRLGVSQLDFNYSVRFNPNTTNAYGGLVLSNITRPLGPLSNELSNAIAMGNPLELEHNIRYLQFPMEGVFALGTHKKINFNLITGLDFLVLQKDDIILKSQNGSSSRVGSANYLSRASISGHIGMGMAYPLNDYFTLQVEPTLIYQLGGYGKDVKHPYPLYFGIYSGLSFKF